MLKAHHWIFITAIMALSVPAWSQLTCNRVHADAKLGVFDLNLIQTKNDVQKEVVEILKKGNIKASIDNAALETVFSHELRIFENRLLDLLKKADETGNIQGALKEYYDSQFYPRVLQAMRLRAARLTWNDNSILPILGDLTAKEVLRLYVGNDPNRVMGDSLVGRYLKESGALLQKRAYTELNRPGGNNITGPEKLLVPVDATTFPIWLKYFSNINGYSAVFHANTVQNGTMIHFDGSHSPLGMLRVNTPLPYVLLKTTEGARLQKYLQIVDKHAGRGWYGEIKRPWAIPNYLSQNGNFNCCTHWHGNLPIGDRTVEKIVLPGANDQPLYVDVKPMVAPAGKEYLNDIWQFPMHEPISSILGLAENNGRGEFASPGWVIQSLLVSAPAERVPAVFYFVENAKVNYDPNVKPVYENPL